MEPMSGEACPGEDPEGSIQVTTESQIVAMVTSPTQKSEVKYHDRLSSSSEECGPVNTPETDLEDTPDEPDHLCPREKIKENRAEDDPQEGQVDQGPDNTSEDEDLPERSETPDTSGTESPSKERNEIHLP